MALAKIVYNSKTVNFGIKPDSLRLNMSEDMSQRQTGSGKTVTSARFHAIEFDVNCIGTESQMYDLIGWWSWARQGKTFSFAVDGDEVSDTDLSSAASSGQKDLLVDSVSGFSVGDLVLVRAEDNDDEFEVIEIDSITADPATLTATENLVFSYSIDDTVRHLFYLPSAVATMKKFSPRRMANTSYYSFSLSVREAL